MGKHASTKGVSNANQLCCTEADGRKRIGGFMASEPHTIRAWVQQKRLTPTKICRRLLFHPDECARFLAAGNPAVQRKCQSRTT